MNRRIHWVIVHQSASNNPAQDSIEAIRELHTQPSTMPFTWGKYETQGRGWKDVGYHYFIRKDGTVEKGREEGVIGAHAKGHNGGSLGVCLSGEGEKTDAQLNALEILLIDILSRHGLEKQDILGHSDVGATDCPGFDLHGWLATREWH